MNSLNSLSRAVLTLVCLFVLASLLRAAEAPVIESAITSNGAIALQVFKMTGDGTLAGVQEYALMVSEDLEHWEEISRSRLVEDLKVVDFEAVGRKARFYRVVGVAISESIRVFAEGLRQELEDLEEFASGILLEGVTFEEYEQMQAKVLVLRTEVVDLLASGAVVPESLLLHYQDSVGAIDQMLVSSPLRVSYDGQNYEVEISEAMRALDGQYKRLGLLSLNEYDRLPGIEADDLVGHESLQDYLDGRRPGLFSKLPVFEALSPYGRFTLTHTLILKHMDILSESDLDDDDDGVWEIEYGMYARLLNGTERVRREGLAIADALRLENPVPVELFAKEPLGNSDLGTALRSIDSFLSELDLRLEENVKAKAYEEEFEREMLAEANRTYWAEEKVFLYSIRETIKRPEHAMELIPGYTGTHPSTPTSRLELLSMKDDVTAWKASLESGIVSFLDGLELSRRWRGQVEGFLLAKLNGYNDQSRHFKGVYEGVYAELISGVINKAVLLQVGSGKSVVLTALDDFWESLPVSVSGLKEVDGITAVLTDDFLEGLSKQSEWDVLNQARLDESPAMVNSQVSAFGRRVQLMEALISAYADQVVSDAGLDVSAFALAVVFNEELGGYLESVEVAVLEGIAELEALDLVSMDSMSADEFSRVLSIVDALRIKLVESVSSGRNGLFWQQERLFEELVGIRVKDFLDTLEAVTGLTKSNLWSKSLRLEIEGNTYLVQPNWIRDSAALAAGQIGVLHFGDSRLSRRQLARFSGVEEEDVLALKRNQDWHYVLASMTDGAYFYGDGLDEAPQDFETYFVFIPKLLESYGTAIVSDSGSVDLALLQRRLVEGLEVNVPEYSSIYFSCREEVARICSTALRAMENLDQVEWASWERMEELFIDAKKDVARVTEPLMRGLSEVERTYLYYGLNENGSPYLIRRFLRDLNYVENVTLRFENGDVWNFNLDLLSRAIRSSAEPSNDGSVPSYSGLLARDYEASKRVDSYLVFPEGGELAEPDLYISGFSREKLVIAALRRLHDEPDTVPALYLSTIVSDGSVVYEYFRRFVEGVDTMHFAMVEEARKRATAVLPELKSLLSPPLTISAVEEAYERLVELNSSLKDYLGLHTYTYLKEDVLEVEEGVTRAYQVAFGVLIDAMRSHPLMMEVTGELKVVPYEAIRARLVNELWKRFPGESIAAHHFASFYGISVADLRRYDKLESFFGNQIVALPRNSSMVKVESKLSDIGMRQLVVDLLERYHAQVFDAETGDVDMDRLIALVSDEELGRERALAHVKDLFDEAESRLGELEEALTLEGLEVLNTLLLKTRKQVVTELGDDIASLSEEGMTELQVYADERYAHFVEAIGSVVFDREIQIEQIDGGFVSLRISDFEDAIAAEMERLVLVYVNEIPENNWVIERGVIYDANWYLTEVEPRIGVDEVPTRLGFHLLVARLIAAYGSTVVSDGSFDQSAFLQQLVTKDEDRASALIASLAENESALWDQVLPSDNGALSWEQAKAINTRFDESYQAFSDLNDRLSRRSVDVFRASTIRLDLNERWDAIVEAYEAAMKERDVYLEIDGKTVLLDADGMLEVMDEAYANGATELLDSYSLRGESSSQYGEKLNIVKRRYSSNFNYSEVEANGGVGHSSGAVGYAFTLGDLVKLPGITNFDLAGISVEGVNDVGLVQYEAKELLLGQLNLRTLAPGSGVQVVGTFDSRDSVGWWDPPPSPAWSYATLSWRETRFRVLELLVLDHASILIGDDGTVDLEALAALLWAGEEEV